MSVNQDSHTVGEWIREHCLKPRALTVGAAADLLGIARPTLSKILNGRMELSAAVAARMETVFAVDAKALLEKQLQTSDSQAQTAAVSEQVRRYVPRFLEVRAGDLVHWADTLDARARLSVLLRRLVHSTGTALRTVDFPGNDDSQRPGWDGWVETNVGNPWIPEGKSGWEFGTTKEIGQKANDDFKKSLKQHSESERQDIVFVFVTPRRWTDKNAWLKEKKALNEWRDVRAYDAVDLEQWLEQSLPAQTWLMQKLGQPTQNVRTLERCWDNWSVVTEPPMVPTFFEAAVENHREKWQTWLNDTVSKKPFVIEADTADMGLAFFCCLAKTVPDATNRILVFDKPGVLPSLVQGTVDFLAVVHSPDVERELASVRDKVRAVVIYPRSQRHTDGAVVLEETTVSMFDAGLKAMALGAERCRILAIETGGSLTVLRRRLAVNRVMQQPVWAETGSEEGRLMAAAALLGTWKETTDAAALAVVSGLEPAVAESCWWQLRLLEDTPVWEIGGVRGVTSKRDVLFAAAANVDELMFRRFCEAAERVFTEKDPAWGLSAEAKRQLVYEVREPPKHSGILKRGTADTLVFLAAYGKTLFGRRLGFDVEESVQAVIHRVLTPMSVERWESNSTWLPFFAEAAPTSFLSWCEDDVRTEQPVLKTMMRPVELFAPCPRIGVLDALEVLAWEKTTFPRAVYLLAKLSEWSADDNYGNTPMRSLRAIFRCRMPQTLADAETRLVVLKRLLKDYPKVGWELGLLQARRDAIGTYAAYNHKPRWRRRETEYGEPQAVVKALTERAVEWLLTQEKYSADQLCDLVKLRSQLGEEKNRQVMALIEAWYRRGQPWQAVEKVRETLRTTVILEVTDEQWLVLLQSCLMLESNLKSEAMLQGLTLEVSSDRRQALSRWLASLTREAVLKLLMLMPFRRWVWQWMKIVVPEWADAYWKTVTPFYVKEKAEALEAVESLLSVNRPRAAFAVVQWQPRMVGAEVLQKILLALLKPSEDKSVVSGAHLKDGVKIVVQASDISRDIKAYIEFFYIDALRVHGSHRAEHIEALEAYITEHPEFYVNLIGWVFRRNDGKPDEAVYQNNTKTYGGISHRTLNAVCLRETLETEMSYENVRDWVNSVRRGCQTIGRGEVADILLGKLAVRSFYDPKTVQFPMNFYRLMTEVDSSEFIQGAMNELLNSRGLRWSSLEDSGDRERSMAEKIQQEMVRIRYEWPRGLEFLGLFERQYMEEAEYHDVEGKRYRRSGSV